MDVYKPETSITFHLK